MALACEFLSVRRSDDNRYHVVSPSDQIRWFVTRFIERSAAILPFDLAIEAGPTLVLNTETRSDD